MGLQNPEKGRCGFGNPQRLRGMILFKSIHIVLLIREVDVVF